MTHDRPILCKDNWGRDYPKVCRAPVEHWMAAVVPEFAQMTVCLEPLEVDTQPGMVEDCGSCDD